MTKLVLCMALLAACAHAVAQQPGAQDNLPQITPQVVLLNCFARVSKSGHYLRGMGNPLAGIVIPVPLPEDLPMLDAMIRNECPREAEKFVPWCASGSGGKDKPQTRDACWTRLEVMAFMVLPVDPAKKETPLGRLSRTLPGQQPVQRSTSTYITKAAAEAKCQEQGQDWHMWLNPTPGDPEGMVTDAPTKMWGCGRRLGNR
jgi:hypothetical protein